MSLGNTSGRPLDELVAEMIEQDAQRGLTPRGSRTPSATMAGLGTQLAAFQEKLRQRREEALASFTGDCIHCLDKPVPCLYCERGIQQKKKDDAERLVLDLAAWMERAGIPVAYRPYSLESYPDQGVVGYFHDQPLQPTEWLLLSGSTGVGKTGLVLSLLKQQARLQLVRERPPQKVIFISSIDLLNSIKATFDAGTDSTARVLDRYRSAPLLVVDDLGTERSTDWANEQFFGIINHRYGAELPTWFTTNLEPVSTQGSELAKHVGDRLFWRIYERARVVKLDGPNLRKEKRAAT